MTIITFPLVENPRPHPHLRRFDVRRDLQAVADLVEAAFADTLDADGRSYIRHLRRGAGQAQFMRWAAGMAERAGFPFSGFVWEENGEVVGNLSLIPMHSRGRRRFLIANVAVREDMRRQGIARALTRAAIDAAAHEAEIWLHVREDNPGAVALYRQLSFMERTRRTSWQNSAGIPTPFTPPGVRIAAPTRAHWPAYRRMLARCHPPHLNWYLRLNTNLLRPGLSGMVSRLVNGSTHRQWVAARGRELLAALSWHRSASSTDRIWLATPEAVESEALRALLQHALAHTPGRKPIQLEFPAGQATGALEAAGWIPHHTLIWMQYGG